jgi:NTP pyrophosphatase (non-canonical NTP hydrolase)
MLGDSSFSYGALRSLSIINSGLAGEAGEASEHIKKWMRDGRINRREAGIELGDTLAYMTWLARVLGYSLEDIAQLNYEKLKGMPPKQAAGTGREPEIV